MGSNPASITIDRVVHQNYPFFMNYLAHAYLSPPSEEKLLGNIACDMIRPGDLEQLTPGIREGIKLHHQIDRRTDSHPAFITLRSILTSHQLPYAGVLVDIINDHFLAANWRVYTRESLDDFSKRVYDVLNRRSSIIPGHFSRLSAHLCHEDWFGQFKEMEGLKLALLRVNYRSSREIPVPKILGVVQKERINFEDGFHALMTSLTEEFKENSTEDSES